MAASSLPWATPRVEALRRELEDFVEKECIPAEEGFEAFLNAQPTRFAAVPPVVEELKRSARRRGLWNLFLPRDFADGPGLSVAEYAPLAEVMGRSALAPEACNCNAPDTGNMELLIHYGSAEQKERWLRPLLEGAIRSAFLMTEPDVASSDARNIRTRIERDGDELVITGRKWWSTGALHPNCRLLIVSACI